MARKKKLKISPTATKIITVSIFALVIGLGLSTLIYKHLTSSKVFSIKVISKDSSVEFIRSKTLSGLIGKNIFKVDLKDVQRRLSYKYPQISQLRLVRRFPDQIVVEAKQRLPLAQAAYKEETLTLDEKGIVLSRNSKQNNKVPYILGLKPLNSSIELGLPLRGKDIFTALKIITTFQEEHALSKYKIVKLDVGDLSEINLFLKDELKVILDNDDYQKKIQVLGVLLNRGEVKLKDVKYIDLRYKDAYVGKK